MKLLAIARVSTRAQFSKGSSINDQVKQIQEYASRIDAVVVDTIKIQVSGAKMKLQAGQLAHAVQLAQKMGAELAVSRLDRLSRHAISLLQLKEISESTGVDIHIASLGRGMKSISHMEMGMLSLVADNERRNIQERVKRACKGRVGPFGKEINAKHAQLKGLAKRKLATTEWAKSVGLHDAVVEAVQNLKNPTLTNVCAWLNGKGQLSRTGRPWNSGTLIGQIKVLGWDWDMIKRT
jgi:DNA invertase Pin-like site-specific DNA recombinase